MTTAQRLTTLPVESSALTALKSLPALPAYVPTGLERAWEFAGGILEAVDTEGQIAWGEELSAAAIVYSAYDTYARTGTPRGPALGALQIAVSLLEAGLLEGSGIDPSHLDSWATMALIGHGMLGEHDYDFVDPHLPDFSREHPATLTAVALASADWRERAQQSALGAPYATLLEELALLVAGSPQAEPTLLDTEDFDGLYAQCMRAVLGDGQTMDICYLSYARLALKQLVAHATSR
jgi:hypothetical protein